MNNGRAGTVTLLALAFVFSPWGWACIAVMTVGAGLLGRWLARGVTIDRRAVVLGAGALFWIAHVVSPFWLLAPSPAARISTLVALSLLAAGWTGLAAGKIELGPRPISLWAPMAVAVTIALLCAPGMAAPLEYRGDEDFHAGRVLAVITRLQALTHGQWWWGAGGAAALVATALRPRVAARIALAMLVGAPVALAVLLAAHPPGSELLNRLGRYPTLSVWAHTAAMFSPAHLWPGFERSIYDEALYRLVPFGATLALGAWVIRIVPGTPMRRIAAALALTTSPLVLYYATAAYLELPAVLLITVGLFGLDVSARRVLRGQRDRTGSAVAISIGLLLKELTLPLGLAIATVCGTWTLKGAPLVARLRRLGGLVTVLLLPMGLFLVWRFLLPEGRAARPVSFDVSLSALRNPDLYVLLPRALLTQLGPGLLLLGAFGAAAAARRRRRGGALWAVTAAGTLVFLAGTDVVRLEGAAPIPAHWGHSRFILLLLPSVLCFALEGFRGPARRSHVWTAIALAVAASHVLLRPIGWDGSRPARWGDVIAETAGERYPYDVLYRWAATAGVRGEMRIIGRDYPYPDDFYLRKYGLDLTITAPRDPSPRSPDLRRDNGVAGAMRQLGEELRLEAARPGESGMVVVHLRAGEDPRSLPEALGARPRLRTFELGEHALVVYAGSGLTIAGAPSSPAGASPRSQSDR